MLTPLSNVLAPACWRVIAQAQHYDVIDEVIIAWSKRLARRAPVDISLAEFISML